MDEDNLPTPKRKGVRWWKKLSHAEKKEALAPYLDAGKSNGVIADLFDISLGSVASIRHKRKHAAEPKEILPSTPEVPEVPAPEITTEETKPIVVPFEPKPWFGEKPRELPKESFKKEDRRAKYPPGKSPIVDRSPDLYDLGGKRSIFPAPREVTGNPDDPSREMIHYLAGTLYKPLK